MSQSSHDFTRRQALAGLGGVSVLAFGSGALGGCQFLSAAPEAASADAKLDDIAYRMLAHEPGRATSLGVDKGEYADWRGTFGTPGQAGRDAYKATLGELLEEAKAYPREGLNADQQIGFEVVETAFSSALEGMALP